MGNKFDDKFENLVNGLCSELEICCNSNLRSSKFIGNEIKLLKEGLENNGYLFYYIRASIILSGKDDKFQNILYTSKPFRLAKEIKDICYSVITLK
ncbi:hypothetical protein KAI32_04090 [Candidatus Pacearchaeota archaeon]|nr:hypothetical protein [Candidatus Pacearchaeota archaeon]